MQCVLQRGRVLRRVLRRGSKKGLSRRHLEGRNTPFFEYDPVGVRPRVRVGKLDGRIHAIVIAESLAREIAEIRITSVGWRSYLLPKHRHWSSETLLSLSCDLDHEIGVHACNIPSTWNCGMVCKSFDLKSVLTASMSKKGFYKIFWRPEDPPKTPKYQKNAAFTRTFSKSSRELVPSSL